MATRPENSPNIPRRRGPRHGIGSQLPAEGSEDLRFFRELTTGQSNRLPVPNIEAQRAGTAMNPVSAMRRLMIGMRAVGMPKEQAIRLIKWMENQANALWPMEQTPLQVLEQRAMALEAADDQAEKCHDLKQDVESLRQRLQTQMAELAADEMVAASLQRRLEEKEGCK